MENVESQPSGRVAIAFVGALRLVGRVARVMSRDVMDPCYEMSIQVAPNGQGGLAIAHGAMPIAMLPSWTRVELPTGTSLQYVDELAATDRDVVLRAMAQGEQMAKAMRASQSGVLVAGPGALNGLASQRVGRR
jgi:hypothetical protein